jgi:hypothetical protein
MGLQQSCVIARPEGRHMGLPLRLYQSPFSSHPPLDAKQDEDQAERPEVAPEPGLALFDDLGRRDRFEPGGDFVEGLFIPIVDRDVFAFARFGNLFQQIGARQSVIGLAVGERCGEAGFISAQGFATGAGFGLDPIGAFVSRGEFAAVLALFAVGPGGHERRLAFGTEYAKLH